MEKIRRYFNQNRKKIIKVCAIILGVIVVIQILNWQVKIQNEKKAEENIVTADYGKDIAIIDDSKKEEETYETEKNNMQEFIDYCINKEYEKAYEILTNECKEKLYPNINVFKANYCDRYFNEKKTCNYQLWEGNTYMVEIRDNIMATGEYNENSYIRDYYTVKNNGINIGGYIGSDEIRCSNNKAKVAINIDSIDYYMDYLKINLTVSNQTDYNIILDSQKLTKSVVLKDKNNANHEVVTKENNQEDLIVDKNQTKKITLKSNISYSSSLTFKTITFSRIILNADNYIAEKGAGYMEMQVEM